MKTKILSLLSLFLLGTSALFAQAKTEKFEVKGNCDMCESRIETTAKAVEGVSTADWVQETKKLAVTFDSTKTSVSKIQKAIADAGHDTPMHKAKDEVYEKLPACCKYDRTEAKKESSGHPEGKH